MLDVLRRTDSRKQVRTYSVLDKNKVGHFQFWVIGTFRKRLQNCRRQMGCLELKANQEKISHWQ